MVTKRTPIIFVKKDDFTKNWLIVTCESYESSILHEKTISNQSNVIFQLENFTGVEIVEAAMKIADAVKGVYSTSDPRK